MEPLESTGDKEDMEVKRLSEVVNMRRDHEIILLLLSNLAFLASLALPVIVIHTPIPGIRILLWGIALPWWWANPLLVAAWVCGYRRWYTGLTVCSITALMLGLSALLIKDFPPFFLGYYAWILSQSLAVAAGHVAPTMHAWTRLRAFLAHPRLTFRQFFIAQFVVSIPLTWLGIEYRTDQLRRDRVNAYETIMSICVPSHSSFPSPYDVEFSETSLNLVQGADGDLQHLSRFALLESLELRGTKFTDQVVRELHQLPALKRLVLSSPHLTSGGLKEVAELKHLEELTIIGGRQIDDEILGSLSNLKSLRSLKLDYTEITGTGLGHLAALPQLEHLALRGRALTDDGLTHLRGLTQIRSLSLSGDQLSDKALEPLEDLTALEQLSIARYVPPSGNVGHPQRAQVAQDGMPFQRGLQQLRSLSLENLNITNEALRSISQLKSLQTLRYSGSFIDEPELQELDSLCRLPELRELALYSRNIAPGSLAKLEGCYNLKTLHVYCPSDSELLELNTLTQIKELKITGEFSDMGLAGVATLTGLKRLYLHGNYTDAGVEQLKELVFLEELTLGANNRQSRRLTDDCLPNLQGLKHLSKLKFDGTKVTDTGVRQLKRYLSPMLHISRIN